MNLNNIILAIILLLLFFNTSESKNRKLKRKKESFWYYIDKPIESKFDTIDVKVKLLDNIDTLNRLVYCGNRSYDLNMNFKIINLISGNYNDSTILIKIYCPLDVIESKWLKNNKEYIFRLCKYLSHYDVITCHSKDKYWDDLIRKDFYFYQIIKEIE